MIEDKELGLKIADNPEEAFWIGFKERAIKAIAEAKHDITINEELLVLSDKKISEAKNGK